MAFRASVVTVALTLVAGPAMAQQHYLGATATLNASGVHSHVGRRTTFVCPAVTPTELAGAQVYGTDQYTYDSAVCIAAIHAGVLPLNAAGPVTFVSGSGADSFAGSSRNGVTSLSYAHYPHSYRFDSGSQPGRIDWITTAQYFPEEVPGPIVVECPSGGSMSYGIWGTGVYTLDSSICMAAVHSGAIPREAGGLVAVTRMPGQASYPSSESNGVTSSAWTTYHASFRVGTAVPDAPMGPAPAVHIYAGSLTIMLTWPPLPGTPTYSVCRESPPGAACQPVGTPVVNSAGDLWMADTYLPPNTVHAYRVRATYPDGRVGETRVTRRNQNIGPPLNPTVDFARFGSNGTVQVSWEPYGMPGMNGPIMFDTHLAMGPGITRSQVVTGDRITVQPPQLGNYEWHICSMVANPAGGWWYSDHAAIVRYTSAGGGTMARTTGPCNVLPEGDGTIIIPPPTTRPGR